MSGKHKRNRAAEHRAKLEAKQTRSDSWLNALTGLGEPRARAARLPHTVAEHMAMSVGHAIHRYGYTAEEMAAGRVRIEHRPRTHEDFVPIAGSFISARRVGDPALDANERRFAQTYDVNVSSHEAVRAMRAVMVARDAADLALDTTMDLTNASTATSWSAPVTPDQILADLRTMMAAHLQMPAPILFNHDDAERTFFARQLETIQSQQFISYPALVGRRLIPHDDRFEYRRNLLRGGLHGRTRSQMFKGGKIMLGQEALDRNQVGALHFNTYRGEPRVGNRHDFNRWVRHTFAPVIVVANDMLCEMDSVGVTLEAHLVELYNTSLIARRRELAQMIEADYLARAGARARTIAVLIEVMDYDRAIKWTRVRETPAEQRQREESQVDGWADALAKSVRHERAYGAGVVMFRPSSVAYMDGI